MTTSRAPSATLALITGLLVMLTLMLASPATARAASDKACDNPGASHRPVEIKKCPAPVANGFVHDLATDTLTVNYGGLDDVLLFSVTMRIPGYEEYTSGVWVGANVWNPTSSNCIDMAPWCNYDMDVTWADGQVVVKNVDASYQGSRVVQIDFYDSNFTLVHTMGGYTAY